MAKVSVKPFSRTNLHPRQRFFFIAVVRQFNCTEILPEIFCQCFKLNFSKLEKFQDILTCLVKSLNSHNITCKMS